jgi:hypothetical protein
MRPPAGSARRRLVLIGLPEPPSPSCAWPAPEYGFRRRTHCTTRRSAHAVRSPVGIAWGRDALVHHAASWRDIRICSALV